MTVRTPTTIASPTGVALRLTLTGRVQGIGLRPAVARFADELSLVGYVCNTTRGVEIRVEGPIAGVERFSNELHSRLPEAADVLSMRAVPAKFAGFESFSIDQESERPVESVGRNGNAPRTEGWQEKGNDNSRLLAHVPPDVVVCEKCLAEVQDLDDRRYAYPFASCTDCGPRYSIVERMPYQREQTGMAAFQLCDRCGAEYRLSADRRFHAQTNACPRCGPRVWLRDRDDRIVADAQGAIRAAAAALQIGRIVALRGVGGYQLLVDATSHDAVARLRQRKNRPSRPLAVMVASLAAAETLAYLNEAERRALCDPTGPIVIAKARADTALAAAVAAGLGNVGLMLPSTPMHWQLADAAKRPLICTSGNVAGDPLPYDAAQAHAQLRDIADLWLEHDRPIRRPIDDTVVRVMAGRATTIRLARGCAPLALEMSSNAPCIALGGHQKTALALANGAQCVLGPHVGDLDTVDARQRWIDQLADLSELYGVDDCQLVHDLHPTYFTTQWAEEQLCDRFAVQHHHAHVAAGMLEAGWLDRQVLGVAFDGTGYGLDETIWGGEFLLATAAGYERVAHLRAFPLPGGERAVREPWRVATALVRAAAGDDAAAHLAFTTGDARSLLPILRRPHLASSTSSAGRLFDGLAALVLGVEQCDFEGQPAMLLEDICEPMAAGHYDLPIRHGRVRQLDWRPLVRQLLADRDAGATPGAMAMRVHRGLANSVFAVCRLYPALAVVLGGGVFQNRVLVELLAERFSATGQPLALPGRIPPNDGGLAAGQLAVAAARAAVLGRTTSCV